MVRPALRPNRDSLTDSEEHIVLDSHVQQRIRDLISLTHEGEGQPLNLRVIWAKFGVVLGDDRWSADTSQELKGINAEFESYIGRTELAKFGQGSPPLEWELQELIRRIRGLERLLPATERR